MCVVMVAVIMAMAVIMFVMMMIVGAEEIRFEIEDAIEIEGVAAEHGIQGNLGALCLVQLGIRINAANARLDFAQLIGRDEIGLVDQDHVGKGDLILGLRGVLEPFAKPFGVG